MSQKAKEFFEQLRGGEQRIGAMEAVKEGVQAVAPALSVSNILSDIGAELKEQWKHGSHELASALFTGNTYVQYARKDSRDEPDHGLSQQAQQQEQSHGGHEL
jgi:DNA topoisomerase IA